MVRVVQDAALDQRQVDLDDVELDLAQQPETGVAGPDIVGRDAHPRLATGSHVPSQLLEVLDLLPLRQLEHELVGRDPVTTEDRAQLARLEML